ncbi:hypothetical protein Patl1_18093 [Pistacia atlantica]|uniref:Uncharacterized protein n=1 Tax=Pistacia atlantica TaxID=434234 RepID=A0ACC1BXX7_9ROSI|nr:hypothetical protein Patl1_18093 [Pistacia atlantica]
MARTIEADDHKELQSSDCFVWDETSQLFFHASTGFYHDPNADWYYSSRDGLYYKFENGNYVLLESQKVNECEISRCQGTAKDNPVHDKQCKQEYCDNNDYLSIQLDESKAHHCVRSGLDESTSGHTEGTSNQTPENPPPPSAWLEETLIDLYLSGYNGPVDADNGAVMPLETDEGDNFKFSADESSDTHKLEELNAESSNTLELEDGELIMEDLGEGLSSFLHTGVSWEEENWRSQYGQVIQPEQEPVLTIPVVELWDWSMVRECRKDGKNQVAKLVGHLVRRSAKLHPSMPSGGGLLKTAPICEVYLDLVRVTTGQVYKLRSPSAKYLAFLSSYDSSNPTKDWGFPEFFPQSKTIQRTKSESSDGITNCMDRSTFADQLSAYEKHKSHAYRDRAAERRILHGGIGVGPGQKSVLVGDNGGELYPDSASTEDAAAEALEMSFGTGSYARRILEGMGWKEGEALGKTTKGLVKPLEAIRNVGSAGLGWPQGRTKHR